MFSSLEDIIKEKNETEINIVDLYDDYTTSHYYSELHGKRENKESISNYTLISEIELYRLVSYFLHTNKIPQEDINPLLCRAVETFNFPIVKLILKLHPTVSDDTKHPPLVRAALVEFHQGVEILLRHGVNVNQSDENGNTALHTVIKEGVASTEARLILDELLLYEPNYNLTNKDGFTPFALAVLKDNDYVFRYLIEYYNIEIEQNIVDLAEKYQSWNVLKVIDDFF